MAIGTIYAEFDVDFTKFERNQQKLLQSAISTATSVEKNWQNLGVKSDKIFEAMRRSIQNSFEMISKSGQASSAEILRAQEAFSRKMKAIDEEQFGKRTSLLENFKKNWLAAAAVMAGITGAGMKIWDMAKVGAGFDEQLGILDNLARKYKTTADTIIEEMDRASKYQIAKSELMSIALGGIAKGLTPEQLINLADAAETLGDVVGKTATVALKELTEALETGRARGLKNYLGAALDLEATFGDLAKKMTDAEKAQAMYNITMLAAIDIQNQQTKELDDAADKIAQIEKKYDDAMLAASRFFKTVVVGMLDIGAASKSPKGSAYTFMPEVSGERPTSDYAAGPGWIQKKATEKYKAEIEALKTTLQLRDDLKKSNKDAEDAAKKAAEARKKEIDLIEKIGIAQIESAGDREAIEAKAYAEWEKVEQKKVETAYKAAEKIAENQIKEQEKALAAQQKQWEHFWENVQDFTADTLYDIFSGNISSWSDMLQSMKNMFLRWAAEIAAQKIRVYLEGQFSSNLMGGGGGSSGMGINSLFSEQGASSLLSMFGSSTPAAGESSMSGLGGVGGGAGTAAGFAIVAMAAGMMLKARLEKSERKFYSGALAEGFPGTWEMGKGISSGSADIARAKGISWQENDWWNAAANSFTVATNEVIKVFNKQMFDFLKTLPKDFADALEQLLARQNWGIGVGNIGATMWPEHEMEKYLAEGLQNIAKKFNETVATIIEQGTGWTLEQFNQFMVMRGAYTTSWEGFVRGLRTGDLAPVQSMETFSYYYQSLLDKVKANPTDANAVNELMQYTSGSFLPFAKSYMGEGADYSSIFNSIISSSGEMYNTVFSGINDQFEKLFVYVKELLDRPIEVTVNLNGNEIANAVVTAVDQGNVQTGGTGAFGTPSTYTNVNQPTWNELGGGP